MKTFFLPVLLACACVAPAVANSSEAATPKDANDIAVIKQIEKEIGDAMVAADVDKLGQIFADDWATTVPVGKITTASKESLLRDFESGNDKLEAFELGPIDVQVLGNSAVAQGGVIETRGKETNAQMIYADLLEKRAGKWVVVRSMGGKVK